MSDVNADEFIVEDQQAEAEEAETEEVLESEETEDSDESEEESEAEESSTEESEPGESGYEKRIAKLTHKLRRAEEQLSHQSKQDQPQKLPEIPALPDPDLRYDDPVEYAKQIRVRDEALWKRAEAEALNNFHEKQAEAEEAAKAQQKQEAITVVVDKYAKRGVAAGLSRDRMAYNDTVLQEAGIGPDLGMYLYEDEKGAKVVDYLARNQMELEKVAKMSPIRAAEYIALTIKPKVSAAKPATTKTPDPVRPVKGSGVVPGEKPIPHGYKIET